MGQLTYTCRYPETRMLGRGVKAAYDGFLLIVTCGRRLAAITAKPGEAVVIIVMERMIACRTK